MAELTPVQPTPVQQVSLQDVVVNIKREDLNHPIVQGNKLHKLKYNILEAKQQKARTLVTFGGAYSNHLVATAYAAKINGFKSVGLVRGDELVDQPTAWSSTLQQCQNYGMQFNFLNRQDYRLKQDSQSVQQILADIEAPFVIPEGGSNVAAIKGVAEWMTEMNKQLTTAPSHVICPVGTGGTLAGIIAGCVQNNWYCQVIGISVLKGLHDVKDDINQWLSGYFDDLKEIPKWQINHQFHCGGYAKLTPEMAEFGRQFKVTHGIELDKIYNVKAFYALDNLIQQGVIKTSDQPLIIHTGGLQGGVL